VKLDFAILNGLALNSALANKRYFPAKASDHPRLGA
jgi:hypothetical protein